MFQVRLPFQFQEKTLVEDILQGIIQSIQILLSVECVDGIADINPAILRHDRHFNPVLVKQVTLQLLRIFGLHRNAEKSRVPWPW